MGKTASAPSGVSSSIGSSDCIPQTEEDYNRLVALLDEVTDEVGEDENHPLASFMDVLGTLVEAYEENFVP
ncbi:MAG: hypothetical protein EBY32_18905, partial [Proteobacteria bacterium]|nr:hypothetical protein [Pseudomonadota bacterium]